MRVKVKTCSECNAELGEWARTAPSGVCTPCWWRTHAWTPTAPRPFGMRQGKRGYRG